MSKLSSNEEQRSSEGSGKGGQSTFRVVRREGDQDEPEAMAVLDVSSSSCRIATDTPVPEHTELELRIDEPGLDEPVELMGQVSWSRRDGGSGYAHAAAVDLSPPTGEELRSLRELPQFFDLRRLQIDEDLAETIPRAAAMEMKIVPFRLDEATDTIHLATSQWHSRETIDTLSKQFGHDLALHYAPSQDIIRAIRFLYGTISEKGDGVSPGTAFLENMLEESHDLRASDIHIQPGEPCQIRYRVDGVMTLGPALERDLYRNLVNRIKVEADLDIAEQRDALDGAFEWETPDGEHRDVRVATIPTVRGEHVSLRLFGPGDRPSRLSELGLSDDQLDALRDTLGSPEGLVLMVGPTGAGKTTTLYAALRDIDRIDNHVVTMEDPVEHRFANVTQIELHGRSKVAVSNMLRSVLRHDPDILTIGEIRDEETLHLTMQSALSGALTLAGLQADDAPSTPVRLINMGAPPYVLASNLRLVLAQRLVRRLCESCRTRTELTEEQARRLGLEPGIEVYEPGACRHCNYMGYRGRIGAFELLPVDDRARRLIREEAESDAFREAAEEAGMVSMLERGANYVTSGVTDPEEVLRSIPHGTSGA
jgi:type II secretory ATPase GspE/PulE/Tfp pilus assembly ATPase PilB-like protein